MDYYEYMRRIVILIFLFLAASAFAQNKVSGVVYLKSDGNPLAGVIVKDNESYNHSLTNLNGEFIIDVSVPQTTLTLSGLGLKDLIIEVKGKADLGRLQMESDVYTLSDAIVTSSISTERVTPVSASTITGHYIQERLGSKEFTEI